MRARRLGVALAALACVAAGVGPSGARAQTEGEYLYNVVTVRAAPGAFADFMEALRERSALGAEAGDAPPFWLRHSQGDQWDFMLIYPMGDFETYYASERVARRRAAWSSERGRALEERLDALTAFREGWLARSAPLEELARRFEGMDFYHIEMFAGLPGKRAALVEQRRMENRYYARLDRQQNLIFVRAGGAPWDAMTLGLYESLQAYAAAGVRHGEAEQDAAAKAAGFAGVGEIGPYLRSLLAYHHDTLAVRAR